MKQQFQQNIVHTANYFKKEDDFSVQRSSREQVNIEILPDTYRGTKQILDPGDVTLLGILQNSLQIELKNPTDEAAQHLVVHGSQSVGRGSLESFENYSHTMGNVGVNYIRPSKNDINQNKFQFLKEDLVNIYTPQKQSIQNSVHISLNNSAMNSQMAQYEKDQVKPSVKQTVSYKNQPKVAGDKSHRDKGSDCVNLYTQRDSVDVRTKFPEIMGQGFKVIKETGRYTKLLNDKKANRSRISQKKKCEFMSELIVNTISDVIFDDLIMNMAKHIQIQNKGDDDQQNEVDENPVLVNQENQVSNVDRISQESLSKVQSGGDNQNTQSKDSPSRFKSKKMVQISLEKNTPENSNDADIHEVEFSKKSKIQRFSTLKDQQKAQDGIKQGNNINLTNQKQKEKDGYKQKIVKRGRTQMGDQTSENGQTLYKISESGLEELSIVESEDLYNSEFDNNDARHNYDQKIQQQMQAAALFKRSGTGGEKSTRHHINNEKNFKSANKKDRSVSPRANHNKPINKNSGISKVNMQNHKFIEHFSICGSSEGGPTDSHFNKNFRRSKERIKQSLERDSSILSSMDNDSINLSNNKSYKSRSRWAHSQQRARKLSIRGINKDINTGAGTALRQSSQRRSEFSPHDSDSKSLFTENISSSNGGIPSSKGSPVKLSDKNNRKKNTIPKIPGFKTNKKQMPRGLSKELDRVPEKEEPDNSPSKNIVPKSKAHTAQNFGAAAALIRQKKKENKVAHLIETDGNILIVNTTRQLCNESKASGTQSKEQIYSPYNGHQITENNEVESYQFDDSVTGEQPNSRDVQFEDNSSMILNLKIDNQDPHKEGEKNKNKNGNSPQIAETFGNCSRKSLVKSSLKSLHKQSNENFSNIKNNGLFIPNQENVSHVRGKSKLYLEKLSSKENHKQGEQKNAYINQSSNQKMRGQNTYQNQISKQNKGQKTLSSKVSPSRTETKFLIKTVTCTQQDNSPCIQKNHKYCKMKTQNDYNISKNQQSGLLQIPTDQIYILENNTHMQNGSDLSIPFQKQQNKVFSSSNYVIRKQKTQTQKTTGEDLNIWPSGDSKIKLKDEKNGLNSANQHKRSFNQDYLKMTPHIKSNEKTIQTQWQNQGGYRQNKIFVDSIDSLETNQEGVIKRSKYAKSINQAPQKRQKQMQSVTLPHVQVQDDGSSGFRNMQSRGKSRGSAMRNIASGQKLETIHKLASQEAQYSQVAPKSRVDLNAEKNLKMKNEVMFQMIKNIYQNGNQYNQAQNKPQHQPQTVVQNFHFNSFYVNNSQVPQSQTTSQNKKNLGNQQSPIVVNSFTDDTGTAGGAHLSEPVSSTTLVNNKKNSVIGAPKTQQNFYFHDQSSPQPQQHHYGGQYTTGKNKMLNQILNTSVPLREQRQAIKKAPRELSSLNTSHKKTSGKNFEIKPTKIPNYKNSSAMVSDVSGSLADHRQNNGQMISQAIIQFDEQLQENPGETPRARADAGHLSRRQGKDDVYKKYKQNAKSMRRQINQLKVGSKSNVPRAKLNLEQSASKLQASPDPVSEEARTPTGGQQALKNDKNYVNKVMKTDSKLSRDRQREMSQINAGQQNFSFQNLL